MTLPLTSPFTSGTKVTKLELDQLVASINAMYGLTAQAVDSGLATITPTAANTTTTLAVSFTDSRFVTIGTPRIFLQLITGVAANVGCMLWPSATTTSGFTLNINRGNTSATNVSWFAVVTP